MIHVQLVTIERAAVGIVAQQPEGSFRFYAIERAFTALEGAVFDTAEKARAAALRLADELDASFLRLAVRL